MKTIQLTQGQLAVVDDEDYDELSRHRWYAHWSPKDDTFYARRNMREPGRRLVLLMHRVIVGAGLGQQVDHVNHDTLDNRRANLRIADQRQNNRNIRKLRGCSSRFKGVSWDSRRKKWRAYIYDGEPSQYGRCVQRFLGYFDHEYDAGLAYIEAAKQSFGRFACTEVAQ